MEYSGQLLGLSGVVFNTKKGSVILCCGEDNAVSELTNKIKLVYSGIEDMQDRVLSACIDLPDPFAHTDADDEVM